MKRFNKTLFSIIFTLSLMFSINTTAFAKEPAVYRIIDSSNIPSLVESSSYSSVKSLTGSDYTIGINAGAWNCKGKIDYTYSEGTWYSTNNSAYVGDTLVCTQDGELIPVGYDYASVELIESLNPKWAVSGYNAVIYDTYYYNLDWKSKHDRSFIGQFQNGDYIIGIMRMASYEDMYNWAKSTYGDDIRVLYNLDGGGSCGLTLDSKSVTAGRKVKNAICFE